MKNKGALAIAKIVWREEVESRRTRRAFQLYMMVEEESLGSQLQVPTIFIGTWYQNLLVHRVLALKRSQEDNDERRDREMVKG